METVYEKSAICHIACLRLRGLALSAPASLSVCKFSLHYPQKINCLVRRIKEMIIHRKLSKNKKELDS